MNEKEIERGIDNALEKMDYELPYEINSYNDSNSILGEKLSVTEINFDIYKFDENVPESWRDKVENAIENVVEEEGGNSHWDDHCLVISIPNSDE